MYRRAIAVPLVAVAVALSAACGSTGGMGASQVDQNTITAAEIQNISVGTAFDAVSKLRPNWLRVGNTRSLEGGGPGSVHDVGSTGLVVYIDGVRAGGPDMLKSINAQSVTRMHYLSPSEATNLYGTGNLFGAIEVTTHHG